MASNSVGQAFHVLYITKVSSKSSSVGLQAQLLPILSRGNWVQHLVTTEVIQDPITDHVLITSHS